MSDPAHIEVKRTPGGWGITFSAALIAIVSSAATRYATPAPQPVVPPYCPTPEQWRAMQDSHNEIRTTLTRLERKLELDVSAERTLRNDEVAALARRVARLERE